MLQVGANNLKNKESVEVIANDIIDVAMSIRNKKKQCVCVWSDHPK